MKNISLCWCLLQLAILMSEKVSAKSVLSDISDELINLFKVSPKDKNATEVFIANELKKMANLTDDKIINEDTKSLLNKNSTSIWRPGQNVQQGESNDEGDLHQRGYVNFAYNHDINICLFDSWSGILKGKVNCIDGPQLCYRPKSASSSTAQFAVCYNNLKHIPDFTGHVVTVSSGAKSSSSARPRWVDESGIPSTSKDFTPLDQSKVFAKYSEKDQQFVNRGHLTPNGDFDQSTERDQTFIITNAAPQWALYNGGNWQKLEDGVRNYAAKVKRSIYVFTGTGGEATYSNGTVIKIGPVANRHVTVPKYFWKAICDPGVGSVVFVGENPIDTEKTDTQVMPGCTYAGKTPINQKIYQGVLYCYSLDDALGTNDYESFKHLLPPFEESACMNGVRGEFIDVKDVTMI